MRSLKRAMLLSLFIFLYGCDIPGVLTIKNDSRGTVVYKYEILNGDSSQIKSFKIPTNEKVDVMFGFGDLWTDQRIREYLESINSIEIISPSDTTYLTDKEQMFNFFKKRRKGLFKNKIKINIE